MTVFKLIILAKKFFQNNKNNLPSSTQKSNPPKKINTKSMRSIESVVSTQQFFPNSTKKETNNEHEEKIETNLNDMSNTQESDMSETPTSIHRVLQTEESGIDHNRIHNFVNLSNIPANAIMTPGSVLSTTSKQNFLAKERRDSLLGQKESSNQNNPLGQTTSSVGTSNLISNLTNTSVSPTIAKRKLPNVGSKTSVTVKIDEDAIFADLKPLKFDGLFKKEFTRDELEEELKKIEAFNQERELIANKKTVGSSRNLKTGFANDNIMTDNAYPFKQETFKLNCVIF